MRRLLLLSLFFTLFISFSGISQHGLSKERLERYDRFIDQEISTGKLAGAVSLIVRNGEVAHERAYGKQEVGKSAPMTNEHLFFIQSMTKPIITVAFMMLYEEGHFFLDDPVSTYIPAFENLKVSLNVGEGLDADTEALKTPITIRHLLSHTAGFSHGLGGSKLDQEYFKAMYMEGHQTVQQRVNRMLELPLIGQPGEQWYYSAAPDVISVLIEQFSGQSTADFLQERILGPLEMNETGYNVSKKLLSKVATVHEQNKDGELVKTAYQPPSEGNTLWSGVNGLFSTAADYMTFCQMLLNNGEWNEKRYLSRKTIELMTKNHAKDLYGSQGFGLGFGLITDLASSQATGSEGQYYWNGAFRTHFFIDPQEKLIAILMTQTNPYSDYYAAKMRQFVYQAIDD